MHACSFAALQLCPSDERGLKAKSAKVDDKVVHDIVLRFFWLLLLFGSRGGAGGEAGWVVRVWLLGRIGDAWRSGWGVAGWGWGFVVEGMAWDGVGVEGGREGGDRGWGWTGVREYCRGGILSRRNTV